MKRLVVVLCLLIPMRAHSQAVDPGPRGGSVGAGSPVAGLSADQQRFFATALNQFTEVQDVPDPTPGNGGLGPAFNSNSCASCHSQPAIGGTSPSKAAFPFVGENPQVAVATLNGATNAVPPFVTAGGPVREARFKFFYNPDGSVNTGAPDGSVHGLFTIGGRDDAGSCTRAVFPQPDFAHAIAAGNISFRIPTPLFGAGLIEALTETTVLGTQVGASPAQLAAAGIHGVPNRNGNDGTVTRFGWKAQNKSLLLFAGEAYNVEVGVTNELFPNERGFEPTSPAPPSCQLNATPEDTTIFAPSGTDTSVVESDIENFDIFMRFLAAPTPSCTGLGCSGSVQDGRAQFMAVGCNLCHTPSMQNYGTQFGPAALGHQQVNLFSDLLLHHMGSGLSDGITQGLAGPDQFRTAPLWGVGQRVFFLHDGRTSSLVDAIAEHASAGSEANTVVGRFNALTTTQKQDLIDFLRTL